MSESDFDGLTVFVVDDDEAVRDALSLLLASVELRVEKFASGQAFLDAFDPAWRGCLVLDVRMPGMNGLALAERLRERETALPIIFITGHGDVPMAVQAMKLGAVDFVQKPFRDQDLLDCIFDALRRGDDRCREDDELRELRGRLETLTPRENEVLNGIMAGKANKVIAADLQLSQRTVEVHRAKVLEKMRAESLAMLVQQVMRARKEA